MTTEFIKDFYGKILGIVETAPNGDITVKSFPGHKILGYYRKNRDVTTDFLGKILSKGNTVISLIYTQGK